MVNVASKVKGHRHKTLTPSVLVRWVLCCCEKVVPQDRIVEVEFPRDVADKFFRLALLDGIGPARFVTVAELQHAVAVREAKP